ncbi:hypothetical protein [Novosphingobium arvoryzae]|uniref:Uncharacterized protein n=1 Tax=Novosphingobium arvoryzae TaxID=1256514 RepID=A0A918RKJ1_9SPHN|nr:hypothetical protein [Novosphingobium arvoryzae]GHA03575.1 hypothetical protein GCM10011617_25870 [Novosphingobium arvoryzae]
MELKFVAAKKPEAINAIVQRRQRLVRRIDQQIDLIQNAKDGLLPRTSWAWIDDKGKYLLHIKYGKNSIELQKGKFAIECDDVEMTSKVLVTIRQMVLSGDLDDPIAQASGEIRARFGKR